MITGKRGEKKQQEEEEEEEEEEQEEQDQVEEDQEQVEQEQKEDSKGWTQFRKEYLNTLLQKEKPHTVFVQEGVSNLLDDA